MPRICLPLLLATAFAALFLSPAASALNGSVVNDSFASKSLGGRLQFEVYLPAGYQGGVTRYPVIYYLHGLPAHPGSFRAFGYVAEALEKIGRPAIVVAPQGAHDGDSDPEYLDWGAGRNWQTAISVELPRVVDNRYRTIAARAGRAIIGVSAGGYGAMNIGLHDLGEFAAIESWSGYARPTDPTGTQSLPREPDTRLTTLVRDTTPLIVAAKPFLGFYVGDRDLFRPDNVGLAQTLSRLHIPFTFRMYPGAHQQSLWTSLAPLWLTAALDHLAPPG